MKATSYVLATLLAAAAPLAHADATFRFAVEGSGLFAVGGTEGCSPFNPDQCIHDVDWTGLLTVETVSGADGTYGIGEVVDDTWVPGGIVRVALASNVGGTNIDAQEFPGTQFYPGVDPYAVTIAGGQVTAIQWTSANSPEPDDGLLGIDGLAITYFTGTYHGPYADVSGTLTAIPEPAASALLMSGLGGLALALLRRRGRQTRPAAGAPDLLRSA